MSRYADVIEVLDSANEIIAGFRQDYERARTVSSVLNLPKVKVKTSVECIRSALEYTAQDIWRSYTTKKNSVYFPYGKDEACFLKSMNKNLPALDVQSPVLYKLVEGVQPHICGDRWIYDLCIASNFNKHNGLSSQKRKNSSGNVVSFDGMISVSNCAQVTLNNVIVGNKPLAKYGTLVVSNIPDFPLIGGQLGDGVSMVREFDWVEFHLDASTTDILSLLSKSHEKVLQFVEAIYTEVGR